MSNKLDSYECHCPRRQTEWVTLGFTFLKYCNAVMWIIATGLLIWSALVNPAAFAVIFSGIGLVIIFKVILVYQRQRKLVKLGHTSFCARRIAFMSHALYETWSLADGGYEVYVSKTNKNRK